MQRNDPLASLKTRHEKLRLFAKLSHGIRAHEKYTRLLPEKRPQNLAHTAFDFSYHKNILLSKK